MTAQLGTLTDSIITALNNAPDGTWSDYSVGTTVDDLVTAKPALDPESMFEADQAGLYVVPVAMLYNRQTSQGRKQIVKLNKGPIIALCLTYRFQTVDTTGLDVSTWANIKKLLNLREEIDDYVLTRAWDWDITNVTAEPAQEIPLKARWFLSVTEIEFSGMSCGTG